MRSQVLILKEQVGECHRLQMRREQLSGELTALESRHQELSLQMKEKDAIRNEAVAEYQRLSKDNAQKQALEAELIRKIEQYKVDCTELHEAAALAAAKQAHYKEQMDQAELAYKQRLEFMEKEAEVRAQGIEVDVQARVQQGEEEVLASLQRAKIVLCKDLCDMVMARPKFTDLDPERSYERTMAEVERVVTAHLNQDVHPKVRERALAHIYVFCAVSAGVTTVTAIVLLWTKLFT